jgi:uncharacterized protein
MYDCKKCPGYCCSYPLIALDKRDVERLAKHFDLSFERAKAKFTVERWGHKYSMRRKADSHFGRTCRFFDTKRRRCTVYEARPSTCRSYPGGRCGYYDFLSFERRAQEDMGLAGDVECAIADYARPLRSSRTTPRRTRTAGAPTRARAIAPMPLLT